MPPVPRHRGIEVRRAYENAGLTREQFTSYAEDVTPKQLTDLTRGGRWVSRSLAARVAHALNQIQSSVHWTADRIFDEHAAEQAEPGQDASAGQAAADKAEGQALKVKGAA